MHPSQLPDVWQLAAPGRRVVALYRTETVRKQSSRVLTQAGLSPEVTVQLLPPDATSSAKDVLLSLPAGEYQPGWQLRLLSAGGTSADSAIDGRVTIYVWTGVLVILGMSILAGLIAQVFRHQLRVARLKNDLVATVSHELKTPLSSIRLLVDTLLDEPSVNPGKTREYLQLIAKENLRLSRLIDNFLAFSRMERNKLAFRFAVTQPKVVINGAVEAMRERLEPPGCHFELQLDEDLPTITGDADALVTAILNLLDNAVKYTGDDKRIALRAYREDHSVCIAVTDNGIGLARTAAKKVFQRFYQVDRRLTRSAGGCGLGLSIVQYIVDAHGGTIKVSSRPGQGSTFTIKLPAGE
jgi:signal transduction histidine kinase